MFAFKTSSSSARLSRRLTPTRLQVSATNEGVDRQLELDGERQGVQRSASSSAGPHVAWLTVEKPSRILVKGRMLAFPQIVPL